MLMAFEMYLDEAICIVFLRIHVRERKGWTFLAASICMYLAMADAVPVDDTQSARVRVCVRFRRAFGRT